ncbi:Homeodomain-like DNA binding domain-containing transcription factor, partial [Phycomyces blakesleeanus NRRL 1555(-)]
KTKATIFAERIGVKNFSASQGWMEKFGKRHCIKMNRIHGEAGSTDIESLQIDKAAIKEKIEGYSACDIYNFDETALFYAAPPRTTISHQKFSGWKDNKKRLTVGLLCNADGMDKWSNVLMIGHARRPNCFNKNNKKQEASDHGFSMYHYNSNAWMTRSIFHVFLRCFDHAMKAQKRKVLLILDNFSGHIVDYTSTNVELLFLPPNTTSHLQPLDGGIIRAFKAYFKRKQYAKAYQYIGMIQNGNQDKIGPIDKIFEIDQLWAMKWIREAWESVSAKTIENCWNATIFHFIEDKDSEGSSKIIYWS